jgi:hypothetical protein
LYRLGGAVFLDRNLCAVNFVFAKRLRLWLTLIRSRQFAGGGKVKDHCGFGFAGGRQFPFANDILGVVPCDE